MKKIIFLSTLALMIVFAACSNAGSDKSVNDSTKFSAIDTTQLSAGATFYQCVMHHEVTADKPGACPKCKMDLVKVEKK